MRKKVSVIGAGFVGTMVAQRVAEKNLADVVLVDIIEGLPQGKALDIYQSASIEGIDVKIKGTNDFSEIKGSRIVVSTAGFPRTPGMSREELAGKNGNIIKSVTEKIKEKAPDCIIIMVTNPLDVMTHLAWKVSGFPAQRVIGMAGILDTVRYKSFLAGELNVSISDIHALVLGGHGDAMVPVESYTTLKGMPISRFIKPKRLQAIIQRTKDGGAEIVKLLKTGSAWHAPSSSILVMVEAILMDSKRILPVSVYLEGEYGISGTYIGAPIKLGATGVEKIYEIDLSDDELAALRRSADIVKKTFEGMNIL
jgi:malate dehydrogenase